MTAAPSILNVHTPSSSFAIVHSITQDSLQSLYDKLSRKVHIDYHGERVSAGWLKYEYNETIWNLDDDADYTIFVWRQQQNSTDRDPSTSTESRPPASPTPTLHLHNPVQPLPSPPSYLNPSYYIFHPSRASQSYPTSSSPRPHSSKSRKTKGSKRGTIRSKPEEDDIPAYKKEFQKFHSENGVRTVIGSIGPVQNVRMLLKSGYRHVYISRKFAMEHGFIPADAAPGHYGYGGLVNIGTWPITLTSTSASASASSSHPDPPPPNPLATNEKHSSKAKASIKGPKPTLIAVYLSEEPHFDVVLGRSFFERRQIKTSPTDLTDVVCLDTGEKVECELVILKDGRGEIVTVT